MSQSQITTSPTTATVMPSRTLLQPLGVRDVHLTSGFWADRQRLNTDAIIPHSAGWVTTLGWTDNLADAGGSLPFTHRGREFADSEIFKLIEAMSWDHARRGPGELDSILDQFLDLVESAQDPDGYLHTLFGRPWQQPRYSDFKWGHELYCFGHLIQAAVAHHRSTGSTRFLDIAVKLADHVCVMFGLEGLDRVCGHAEIELALVELFRETGNRNYLDQASIFIERRGTGTLPLFEFGAAFWQDDLPVRAADVLRGHAVRALYLAAGAVDVAVETGDDELLQVLELQWDNTVARRTYITGGMGSHHMDEAFGDDFVLPPDRSYCETCAGVASIMFSWRLLLATGKAKFADLIERTLYNVVATSPGQDGRSFFYANTLHQRTTHAVPAINEDGVTIRGGATGRQPWFEVSCCPPNVARTLASLGAYIATTTADGIQIHQLTSSTITADFGRGTATVEVKTDYPSSGALELIVHSAPPTGIDVDIRVPDWATDAILTREGIENVAKPGYATVRKLHEGDHFTLMFPLHVRLVEADARIDAIRGTTAIERGPEIYALESIDLPAGVPLEDSFLVNGTAKYDGSTVRAQLQLRPSTNKSWPFGSFASGKVGNVVEIQLVRYHEWAQRGPSTMRVWIPNAMQ